MNNRALNIWHFKHFRLAVIGMGLWLMSACHTQDGILGVPKENRLPDTYMVVDTIVRWGDDRFTSTLQVHWWGTDPDGWVVGYELRLAGVADTAWTFTTAHDSIFLLNIPAGSDTFDAVFEIRAIDNTGAFDPSPARLRYPVRNSVPTLAFVYPPNGSNPLAGAFPTHSFTVLHFAWQGSDPDGAASIERYELCLNDTTQSSRWLSLPPTYTECILQAETPNGTSSSCLVFPGDRTTPLTDRLQGLILSDSNRLYVRVIDRSGAKSDWTESRSVFVRTLSHNILFVNAFTPSAIPNQNVDTVAARMATQLALSGINQYHELRIFERSGNAFTQLSANNATQSRIFDLFDHIIWLGGGGYDFDQNAALTQYTMGRFLDGGGNLLMSLTSSAGSPATGTIYELFPFDSLLAPPDGYGFLLTDTATLSPLSPNYPILGYDRFNPAVRPLKLRSGTTGLYKANIWLRNFSTLSLTPSSGPSTVMALRYNPINQSRFAFTTLELHSLNRNGTLSTMLSQLLRNEFGIP